LALSCINMVDREVENCIIEEATFELSYDEKIEIQKKVKDILKGKGE